jgi:AAA+ ATPase superfamily predicted ATPase
MAKKKVRNLDNPFVFKGYEGPEYFCDRTEETERMLSALRSRRNITLISPRKFGKTGLIKHVFHLISAQQKDAICLYIDIFATSNTHEFVELFCSSFVEEVMERQKSFFGKAFDAFKGWRPTLTADPLTGAPQVSVSIEPVQTTNTLKGIFDYIEQLDKQVYIAIDEFQQITEYPEKGTEALLRSYIQFSHASFIFSGSKFHLMSEMFLSPKRPFYQSTEFLNLQTLHEEIYFPFARHFFEQAKGCLSEEVFHDIYTRFDGITWYVQIVLNKLFDTDKQAADIQYATQAIDAALQTVSTSYEGMLPFLTPSQKALLRAIAREEPVEQPLRSDFIKKHDLPSTSTIKSALETLQRKELIYRTTEGYTVYDRFLSLWLRRTFASF